MTTQNLGLFQALNAKMNYLDQRQKILAQNIANANTPDYKPKDLTKVDFGTVLKDVTESNTLRPETTNPMHMPSPHDIDDAKSRKMKRTYDVMPTGNAVVMEEQMVNSAQTSTDYNLMTTLYQKNVNMIRIAIGSGSR
jgi:flagellar basal-body rod protein FlgB